MGQHTQPPPPTGTTSRSADPSDPTPCIGLKVIKGALVPETPLDQLQLRRLNLSLGQVVHAQLDWLRIPADLKRIHRLGQLLVEQLPAFAHLDHHMAIKVLQSQSGAGCDVISVPAGTLADLTGRDCRTAPEKLITVFQPWSLSPRTMSGAQFAQLFDQLCRYVAAEVWPDCDPDEIANWTDTIAPSCP